MRQTDRTAHTIVIVDIIIFDFDEHHTSVREDEQLSDGSYNSIAKLRSLR